MKYEGVIFDFDGTIANSCYVWAEVDRVFFADRGMEVPEDYFDNISTMGFVEGAHFTKDKYNIKESAEEIMKEWHDMAVLEYENNVALKPMAKEYIHYIKKSGAKVGLATASNPEYYMPVLKRYGILDWFDYIVDGKSGLKGKDTPEMYMYCANNINVKPNRCEVYEDIYKGIVCAKSIGMATVGVYDIHNKRDMNKIMSVADRYIRCFDELLGNK